MKRWMGVFVLLAAFGQAAPVSAAVYYGFQVGVSNAPPAPVIRTAREPHCVLATDAMVYVVQDEGFRVDGDAFHYGQYWFVYTRGYWYRGRSSRGPYSVIDVRKVPRAILGVPRAKWKHHPLGGPPGQLKKERLASVNTDEMRKGHGRGRGKGR